MVDYHFIQRLLVLSGSAGTGKTATIRLLCQDMGVEIIEFRTGKEGGAGTLENNYLFNRSIVKKVCLQTH